MPDADLIMDDDGLDYGEEFLLGQERLEELEQLKRDWKLKLEEIKALRERVIDGDKANVKKADELNVQGREMHKLASELDKLEFEVTQLRNHAVPIKELEQMTEEAMGKLNTLLHRLHASEEHWHMLSSWLWTQRRADSEEWCWCSDATQQEFTSAKSGVITHGPLCQRIRYYFKCPPRPISGDLPSVTDMTFEEVIANLFKGGECDDSGDDEDEAE